MVVSAIQDARLTSRRRRELAFDAAAKAHRVRKSLGLKPEDPVCPYKAAERQGIEVRFLKAKSMEGVYSKHPRPVIVVSSLRPPGRQAFTAAHELGHHVYKHGSRVDVVSEASTGRGGTQDPDEYVVDRFAGFFLMTKTAVMRAFAIRGWDAEKCNPGQVYVVAGWLGVGYSTLVYHMRASLGLISYQRFERLRKVSPRDVRAHILGSEAPANLLIVDGHWTGRAADVRVGDLLRIPAGVAHEADNLETVGEVGGHTLLLATAPGLGRLYDPRSRWAVFVRASRSDYEGRVAYRHREDPDYGEAEDGDAEGRPDEDV